MDLFTFSRMMLHVQFEIKKYSISRLLGVAALTLLRSVLFHSSTKINPSINQSINANVKTPRYSRICPNSVDFIIINVQEVTKISFSSENYLQLTHTHFQPSAQYTTSNNTRNAKKGKENLKREK